MMSSYACISKPGPVCMKQGRQYGTEPPFFIGKWSDYYIRALSYMEGECYDAALSDLHSAMKQRFKDSRTERYYGMHFMSYFPHREAGVIYFLTNRPGDAKKELLLSMSHCSTAKTKFYLKKSLKQILLDKDTEPGTPLILLDFQDKTNFQTSLSTLLVSGVVNDEHGVSSINISNKKIPLNSFEKQITFSKRIVLNPGINQIRIKAENILDEKSIQTLFIRLDQSGPLIVVRQFHLKLGFKCDVIDPAGISRIIVNGKEIKFTKGNKVSIHLKSNILETMLLNVFDAVGNSTETQFHLQDFKPKRFLTAMNSKGSVRMSDTQTNPVIKNIEISTKFDFSECTAYENTFDLQGKVKSYHPVSDFAIQLIHSNSQKNQMIPLETFKTSGCILSFHETIPLNSGKNIILMKVTDSVGNKKQKQLIINRERSEVFKLKYRMGIDVYPLTSGFVKRKPFLSQIFNFFMNKNKVSDTGKFPNEALFQSLLMEEISSPERFQIFISDHLQSMIEHVHENKKNNQSQKTGKAFSSLTGDIFVTNQGLEIVLKIIQNDKSEILSIVDSFENNFDLKSLQTIAKDLSDQLHDEFPLVKGKVVHVDGQDLDIAIEDDAKLFLNQRLLIYRKKDFRNNVCPFQSNSEFLKWAKVKKMTNGGCIAICDDVSLGDANALVVTH